MKKCLSLLIALSMVLAMCVVPVSAETTPWYTLPEGAQLIFAENFEEGFESGNLLTAKSVTINKNDKKVLTLSLPVEPDPKTYSAEVTTAADLGFTSNVLKLSNTSTTNKLHFDFFFDGGNAVDFTTEGSPYYGMQLVLEYDAYGSNYKEADFMRLDSTTPGLASQGNNPLGPFQRLSGSNFSVRNGAYGITETVNGTTTRPYMLSDAYKMAKATNFRIVFDQTGDVDVNRTYVNGALLHSTARTASSASGAKYAGKIVKDYVGEYYDLEMEDPSFLINMSAPTKLQSDLRPSSAGTGVAYIDNILVYAVPSIDFEEIVSATSVNPANGIEVKFTAAPKATVDTFKITDVEGNAVAGAEITDVTVEGNSAFVKVAGLADSTEYKLFVDDEFASVAGALFYTNPKGIDATNDWVELSKFKTCEILKAVEAPEAINGLIPNDPRNVEFKTTAAVDSVSATYNGGEVKTSMIGTSAFVSFESIEKPVDGTLVVTIAAKDGQKIELSVPVTAVSDEIDYIYNDGLDSMPLGKIAVDETKKNDQNGKFVLKTNAASLAVAGSAAIVEDAEQGRVLEMSTLSAGNFSVLYDAGKAYDTDGKVLVIQTKYKVPSNVPTNDGINYGAFNNYASSTTGNRALSLRYRGSDAYISMGKYLSGIGASLNNTEASFTTNKGNWADYTTVVDKSTDATGNDPHTFRYYYGGKLASANVKNYTTVYPDATVVPKVYDWAMNNYLGLWDHSGIAPAHGGTSYGTVAMPDFHGTYTEIPVAKKTSTEEEIKSYQHSIYIDDFRAFFADKFVITSISDNKDAFIPTRHTLKVVFNQKVSADQLSEVKLIDQATGEAVTGWSAVVANGGYALDFTLPVVAAGNTYKLAFTPEFHDITSYQGLSTNNHDYVTEETITIADYTPFTATGYQESFVDFEQGRTAKTVVTLSVATKLTDSDAKSAFKVVNDEGVEIADGWTAAVDEDQKSITLDFTNLATDNYTVTSTDALVNKDGDKLEGEAVEITIAARIDKIMLFEEDFDGNGKGTSDYELGVDWLDAAPANGKWTAGYSRARSDKTAYANDKIEVVNTLPEGAAYAKLSGNALHVYAEQETTKVTKGIAAKAVMDPIDIAATYPGKVLIMEADVYGATIGDGTKPLIASFTSALTPSLDYFKHNGSNFKYEGTWFSPPSHTGDAYHMRWLKGLASKDAKFVTVIDQRNELDTVKIYANGQILTEKSNTLITDHPLYQQTVYEFPLKKNSAANIDYWGSAPAGSFYGPEVVGQTTSSSAVNTDMYIDNIKVYLVDAFEITSIEGVSTAFNAAKDTVKFNFTNKVKSVDNVMANIKITDAEGAAVEYAATLAEGGYQVVVDIDDQAQGELKITVSPEIQDEFGQSLAHKYYDYQYTFTGTGTGYLVKHGKSNKVPFDDKDYAWVRTLEEAEAIGGTAVYEYTWEADGNGNVTMKNPITPATASTFTANGWMRDEKAMKLVTVIKTTKSTSLYAEATKAVVDGMNVSTTLQFTNPEEDTLPVWYIVAAYGEYNEMIGCKSAALNVEKGVLDPIDVSFTTTSPDIKAIKVYVWDGYKTMIPYQPAEDIK